MSEHPFPVPGPGGDKPPPGAGARDGAEPAGDPAETGCAGPAGTPAGDPAGDAGGDAAEPAGTAPAGGAPADVAGCGCDDDFDADADLARFIADIDAGLIPVPPEPPPAPSGMPAGPAVLFSLGEAAEVDPAELAVMAGPGGLGGQVFAQDRTADAMRPGPLLSILSEQAAENPQALSDDELLGLVSAARRLQARAEYLELGAIAEFAHRRQAQHDAAAAGGARPGRRAGEFADEELGVELMVSARAAGDRMDLAADLATRLPCTFAALAAGLIDGGRARTIWYYTRFLSGAHAAQADAVLAEAAPGLRPEQLDGKAARLEMKLDPQAVAARRAHASSTGRRVETRRELSGNLCYGGRELGIEEALAAKAAIDADAAALRNAGLPGSLRELGVLAFLDRLAGRNPLDRVITADQGPAAGSGGGPAGSGGQPGGADHRGADEDFEEDPDATDDCLGEPGSPGSRAAAPLPALINLIIPAGTLLGWSTAPGQAGNWGLLDPEQTRSIVETASRHPRTRWCITLTGPDGTATAHGCARGQHSWTPPPLPGTAPGHQHPRTRAGPGQTRDATHPPPGPDPDQAAQLAALLRALNVTMSLIAKNSCDHRDREDRYTPSRRLGHRVRARTATCIAPGCSAQAVVCDLDHTIPWPIGITCQCDLSPGCRRHHRVKQAPGWHLDQPEPGTMRWTAPSGRVYTTRPTIYET